MVLAATVPALSVSAPALWPTRSVAASKVSMAVLTAASAVLFFADASASFIVLSTSVTNSARVVFAAVLLARTRTSTVAPVLPSVTVSGRSSNNTPVLALYIWVGVEARVRVVVGAVNLRTVLPATDVLSAVTNVCVTYGSVVNLATSAV